MKVILGPWVNPPDRWSGEGRRPRDRYLTTEELARQRLIVGRLVKTDEGWYLVPVSQP